FVLVTERFRITDSDWATVVTAYGSPTAARATLDAPSAPTSRTTSETTASATSSKCAWRYTPLPVPGRASPSAGPPSASPTGWRPRLPPGRLERMDGTTCFPGLIPRLPPSGVQDPAPLTPARRRSAPDAPAAVARHHHARYNQTSTESVYF